MVGGVPGGRSTYGICLSVLSWAIRDGRVGEIDVSGLAAVLVGRYRDDEAGSPWSVVLHVDRKGDERQRAALQTLFLDGLVQLPWIRKARHLIDVYVSEIELDDTRIRVGSTIAVRASRAVETSERVACGIPGYEREGRELYTDEFFVDDDAFFADLSGNCAYESSFNYASA
jgi:hypothetical protein